MSESQPPKQLQEQQNSKQKHQSVQATLAPHVKTSTSTEQQTPQTNPTSPQTPTFDSSQYQATLSGTPVATFARTASA